MTVNFHQVGLSLIVKIAGVFAIMLFSCSLSVRAETAPRGLISALETPKHVANENALNRQFQQRCLIDASRLNKLSGRTYYIVKTAREKQYAASLRDVLVIPLNQIKLRQFLKHDTLVLLPRGIELNDYLRVCGKLRMAGYPDVFVLRDGMIAAGLHNKSVNVPENYKLVTPEEFYIERHARHWIVVFLTHVRADILKHHLPSGTQFVKLSMLKSTLRKINKTALPLGILFVDANGHQVKRFYKIARSYPRSDVFYLEHGISGLTRYVRLQHLIAGKHVFVLQTPRHCGQ